MSPRPNIRALLEFQGADVWGEGGAEEYYETDPIAAVLRIMDDSLLPVTGGVAEYLRDHPQFITVEACRREGVSASTIERWADSIAQQCRDLFDEDYSHPEHGDRLSPEDEAELNRRVLETVSWYVGRARVGIVEPLRRFTLDSGDILELIQQHRPEWLLNPS